MRASDAMRSEGHVEPSFIDVRTGRRVPIGGRHNTLSFDATHAMALAFGGDGSLVPNRVGIVYGRNDNIEFSVIGRDQPWDGLKSELAELGADMQIQSFCYSPSFTPLTRPWGGSGSGSSPDAGSGSAAETGYPGWGVTFHAHSDSVTPGVLSAESGTASPGSDAIFTNGAYLFQAVLLNKTRDAYTVLARASLKTNGKYYPKPDDFEVALDWTIKFF